MAQTQDTLELLLEVGRLLSSKLDRAELLQTVLELGSRVVDAESASVLLLDPKTQELYFDVALDLGEKASKLRLKLGEGIAGTVAKTLKPEIINDVTKDARWSPGADKATGFTTRSILAVPMSIKGQLIGVVEAINKRGGGFEESDLRAFEAFASQAAVAIENARLFTSLKEERFKLRTVFSEMTDGAVLADETGSILLANDAARKLLGVGGEPASLHQALEKFAVTPPLHEILPNPWSRELDAVRELPTRLLLKGRATRVDLGWLFVLRDDTEAWQKEKLKRSFLSLISHKLKTPLSSVSGFSELLAEDFKTNPPKSPVLAKAVNSIVTQSRKLADLVDKLLRYTTLENPENAVELKPVNLDDLIAETVGSMRDWLADHKGEVLHQRADPVVVTADRLQLGEALKNLLENAVKFDEKDPKKVSVWVEKEGGSALLRVRDTGRGIPPEEQEKVFERFHQIESYFTGQVEGWGLGLSYVKKIVESHGGKVELKSRLGEGTTVTMRLPMRTA